MKKRYLRTDGTLTHGMSGTPIYAGYRAMLQRCHDPNHYKYLDYGARGIRVCRRWRGSLGFDHFLSDMGLPPPGRTLDRQNNDKGYSPQNCRWATRKEQGRNTRVNRLVTYRGKTQPLSAWIDELGLSMRRDYARLYYRIFRYGWPVERAIETPPRPYHRRRPQNRKCKAAAGTPTSVHYGPAVPAGPRRS